MDTDITKMFLEKNKEIFENSLNLEINRNLEALKQTTDNCVILEINKVSKFLNNLFREISLNFESQVLSDLIDNQKKKLNNIVNDAIEDKKKLLKEYFENYKKTILIEEEYINKYYKVIDNTTLELSDYLETQLRIDICTLFTPAILRTFKLNNENEQERIKSRIDGLLTEVIIRRMKEEIVFRDNVLKNMCSESFKRYLELNKQTVE